MTTAISSFAVDYRRHAVLFVDDDPTVVSAFRLAYGDELNVICTTSPEEALEILRSPADLAVLLVDQRMPRMTGAELLNRSRRVRPDLTRMLMTAYADLDAVVQAVNEGQIARYITKPWRHEELLSILQHGIERYYFLTRVRELQLEVLRGAQAPLRSGVLPAQLRGPLGQLRAHLNQLDQALAELDRQGLDPGELSTRLEELRGLSRGAVQGATLLAGIVEREHASDHAPERLARELPVDLSAILEAVVPLCSPRLVREERVELKPTPGLRPGRLDPTPLAQLLFHLVGAAARTVELGDAERLTVRAALDAEGALRLQVAPPPPPSLASFATGEPTRLLLEQLGARIAAHEGEGEIVVPWPDPAAEG